MTTHMEELRGLEVAESLAERARAQKYAALADYWRDRVKEVPPVQTSWDRDVRAFLLEMLSHEPWESGRTPGPSPTLLADTAVKMADYIDAVRQRRLVGTSSEGEEK